SLLQLADADAAELELARLGLEADAALRGDVGHRLQGLAVAEALRDVGDADADVARLDVLAVELCARLAALDRQLEPVLGGELPAVDLGDDDVVLDDDIQVVPVVVPEELQLRALAAADVVADLELWAADVDAAVGLEAGPELELEVEGAVVILDG